LKSDISNFVKSTENFQKIMGSQVSVFDKACIDFKTNHKQKKIIPEKITKKSEGTNVHIVKNMDISNPFVFF